MGECQRDRIIASLGMDKLRGIAETILSIDMAKCKQSNTSLREAESGESTTFQLPLTSVTESALMPCMVTVTRSPGSAVPQTAIGFSRCNIIPGLKSRAAFTLFPSAKCCLIPRIPLSE